MSWVASDASDLKARNGPVSATEMPTPPRGLPSAAVTRPFTVTPFGSVMTTGPAAPRESFA